MNQGFKHAARRAQSRRARTAFPVTQNTTRNQSWLSCVFLLKDTLKRVPLQLLVSLEQLSVNGDFAQTKRVDGQMTHAHTHGPNQLLETLHRERLKLDTSKAADTSSVVSDAQVIDAEQISDDGGGREGSVPI